MNFEERLKFGQEFEDAFFQNMINRGWHVIPKYLFCKEGAPLMFGLNKNYCAPDLDACKNGKRIWIECKRKNIMKCHPATGYAEHYHEDYKKVKEITGNEVWIVFKDDSLEKIYGNEISELEKHIYRIMPIMGKPHILFKYPEAFKEFKLV